MIKKKTKTFLAETITWSYERRENPLKSNILPHFHVQTCDQCPFSNFIYDASHIVAYTSRLIILNDNVWPTSKRDVVLSQAKM